MTEIGYNAVIFKSTRRCKSDPTNRRSSPVLIVFAPRHLRHGRGVAIGILGPHVGATHLSNDENFPNYGRLRLHPRTAKRLWWLARSKDTSVRDPRLADNLRRAIRNQIARSRRAARAGRFLD